MNVLDSCNTVLLQQTAKSFTKPFLKMKFEKNLIISDKKQQLQNNIKLAIPIKWKKLFKGTLRQNSPIY